MSEYHVAKPCLLLIAVMYLTIEELGETIRELSLKFGKIHDEFGPIEVHNFTDYYAKEMGSHIFKKFFTFSEPIYTDTLHTIKTFSHTIEEKFKNNNGYRRINIDPGYITAEKLVLASTKDFFHRIYLKDGIFAEVTLHYQHNRFRHFSWTYPDYRTPDILKFLEKNRDYLIREHSSFLIKK